MEEEIYAAESNLSPEDPEEHGHGHGHSHANDLGEENLSSFLTKGRRPSIMNQSYIHNQRKIEREAIRK
jgi:hypothetical protein